MPSWEPTVAAWVIFLVVYIVLAIGHLPVLNLDRTGVVFVGATAAVAFDVLSLQEAHHALDFHTLLLLFSMMICVSFLVQLGVLDYGLLFLDRFRSPRGLLWAIVWASGIGSALFINDVICLVLTPIVLQLASKRKVPPEPFLLAVAMASNIGSLATPIGNPQNMLIASLGEIRYPEFVVRLAPLSLFNLLVLGLVLQGMYRRVLKQAAAEPIERHALVSPAPLPRYVWVRTLAIMGGMVVGFWMGYSLAGVAALGAAAMMLTRRVQRARAFELIDWDLLVLFAGLFIVTAAAAKGGVLAHLYEGLAVLRPDTAVGFSCIVAVLSNSVGNVPAVFFLSGFVQQQANPTAWWFLLACVSTLAGNLTLVGSVANLIVAEKAKESAPLTFGAYLRVGVPVGVITLTLALGYWYLVWGR
ncbi:MAG: anion transporter [Armatimonadetes bacterium JP3_11]|jgi:Na+/H+ antiporter NhaD/arsenite permease-like protein|nr:MAG: anion transporter [Armatimonadetes bacterium CP1_7O]OYT75603.1 MAG: anion transporter [Armatimonadetes bacterium JP3_11]RMH08231.1 MAG: anion transporter [Armatimonadota bacterium]